MNTQYDSTYIYGQAYILDLKSKLCIYITIFINICKKQSTGSNRYLLHVLFLTLSSIIGSERSMKGSFTVEILKRKRKCTLNAKNNI